MSELLAKIPVDLIVFDLDGTLADSLPDLTVAANLACRGLGLPERTPHEVAGMIGGGERKFMERLAGPENQRLVDDLLTSYLEYYSTHAADLTRLYPGVRETLEQLKGRKLAVLSNKLQRLTDHVLQALGLAHLFNAIRGGGPELPLKPSPQPLTALMQTLAAAPGRTLMVGDKPADVMAARGAGARIAAVTYGYGEPAALKAAAPDFLLDHFGQLLDIIE